MKKIIILLYILCANYVVAQEWRQERTNIYFDNDIIVNTDSQYTEGLKISNVYFMPEVESDFLKIPYIHDDKKAHFLSFGLVHQMYTPADINESKLIVDDRPYAGWFYLEMGLHQSSKSELDSLVLQFGVVGKASLAEKIQKEVHRFIGSDMPQGWDNQLNSEIGINLTYQHKWRYVMKSSSKIEGNIIPFVEANVGNIRTSAGGGILMRYGWTPVEDFGSSSIDTGGENGIPIRSDCLCPRYEPWSFTLNFSLGTEAVAHDIFLDGNTFTQSHSVQKENFIFNGSIGFSARYEHFAIDYTLSSSTRHFKQEPNIHKFGTLLVSYLY